MNRFKTFARIALPCRGATLRRRNALLIVVCAALLFAPARFSAPAKTAGETQALFDVSTPAGAPFPSDLFTVADPTQNTGLRVNLPMPDCSVRPSHCEDLE